MNCTLAEQAPPCRGRRCPAQARYRADVRDRGTGWLDVGVPLCPYHLQWVSNHGRLVAFEEVRAVPGVGT